MTQVLDTRRTKRERSNMKIRDTHASNNDHKIFCINFRELPRRVHLVNIEGYTTRSKFFDEKVA